METDSGIETCIFMKSAWCNSFGQAGQQLLTPGCDDHKVHTDAESNRNINQDSGLRFKIF